MGLYRIAGESLPALAAPVMVAALEGWVDAAGAASAAAERLAADGDVVARFDTDELIDYRARRPVLDIVDGDLKSLAWPDLVVRHARAGGRDLLVLTGPEPDYRWREFSTSVLEFALRAGVVRFVVLGSLGMAVPHTLPSNLIVTASDPSLISPDDQRPEGFLRVPAAAVSVIEMTVRDAGIPTVGLFAQTPHYVTSVYHASSLALIERLSRLLEVPVPLGRLIDEATEQRAHLDRAVADRPEIKEYVERLEAAQPSDARMPTGDELAAEIERYLRDQGGSSKG